MTNRLKGTPDWVSRASGDGTEHDPAVGDVWTLGWDSHFEGAVVITGVYDNHVLGMPVTNNEASATEIAVRLGDEPLCVWPQAETGLGTFLLHERLREGLLTGTQTVEVRRWEAQVGDLDTLTAGTGEMQVETLHELLEEYQRLCFVEWPSDAEASLDVDAVGMTPLDFAALTGLTTPRVLDLWNGLPVGDDERQILGTHGENWLTVVPDAAITNLSKPAVKDLLLELMALTGDDERSARNGARHEYCLAARSDSAVARDAGRAVDTVRSMIENARAAGDS